MTAKPGETRARVIAIINTLQEPFSLKDLLTKALAAGGLNVSSVSPTVRRLVATGMLRPEPIEGVPGHRYRYFRTGEWNKREGQLRVVLPPSNPYMGRVLGYIDSRQRPITAAVIAANTHTSQAYVSQVLTSLVARGMLGEREGRFYRTNMWTLAAASEAMQGGAPAERPAAARHMQTTEGLVSMEDIRNLPKYKADSERLREILEELTPVVNKLFARR